MLSKFISVCLQPRTTQEPKQPRKKTTNTSTN